jgi:dipeptidyl aminopeptidase/acylaminoacyl peptidase
VPLVTARVAAFPGPETPLPALVYPAAAAGSDLVVVALHGGPIARWSAEYTAEFQLFARLGLPVVALNYPGSTGSGQDHMRSLFGRAGTIDVEAVAAVVDALQGEGRRVLLYGESYGAFLALATAAVRPCAGVIAFAPFASFARLRESGSPEITELLDLLDEGNPLGFGRNLLTTQRTIRCNVLIAHGTADRTIPVAESRELARLLRGRDGAGEDKVRLVELHGQGHRLFGRDVLEHWFREVADFTANVQGVEIACTTRSQQQGRCAGGLENTNPGRR